MLFIAGAFSHFVELKDLILEFELYKRNICVYDGVNIFSESDDCDCNLFLNKINIQKMQWFNDRRIGVGFSLSNREINFKSDVFKTFWNFLQIMNKNPKNFVIIANEDLRRMIRNNLKNIRIIRSITAFDSFDTSQNNFRNSEADYDLIIPSSIWTFNSYFHKRADLKKYVIIMNKDCSSCVHFFERSFTLNHADFFKPESLDLMRNLQNCWNYDCIQKDLSVEELHKCMDIGYEHFLIRGRELIEDYYDTIKYNILKF